MNEQRNIDWTAAFALAARAGPHALVRALSTAMETEFAAFTEKYDAILARQRATCDDTALVARLLLELMRAEGGKPRNSPAARSARMASTRTACLGAKMPVKPSR